MVVPWYTQGGVLWVYPGWCIDPTIPLGWCIDPTILLGWCTSPPLGIPLLYTFHTLGGTTGVHPSYPGWVHPSAHSAHYLPTTRVACRAQCSPFSLGYEEQ